MTKDEILEKSRSENNDEGLRDAENRGIRKGIAATRWFSFFIILLDLYVKKEMNYALYILFLVFSASESYPMYQFTKKKSYLFTTILYWICAIIIFIAYVKATLGQ